MRTRIYFVRHAEAQSNVDPLFKGEDNLTMIGLQQAKAVAFRFKEIPIENIYVSKTLRAQLTAKEIGAVTGSDPIVKDFLYERKGSHSNDTQFIHSEIFDVLKERLRETKNFLEKCEEKHVVVVSHAIFLKSLAAYIMLAEALNEELMLKISNTLTIDNTAVSKFVFNKEKSKWHMEFWNDQVHLS